MTYSIRLVETFLFYDIAQVFAAEDQEGGRYLGFLHEERANGPLYLLAGITTTQLDAYRAEKTSLSELMRQFDAGQYSVLTEIPDEGAWHSIHPMSPPAPPYAPVTKQNNPAQANKQKAAWSSHIGQPERATQNRVVKLFRQELGYRYLGDWTGRAGPGNIEENS